MNARGNLKENMSQSDEPRHRVDNLLRSEAARHFRDRMRNARATALKDAENFDEIVFCVESLGQLLLRKVGACTSTALTFANLLIVQFSVKNSLIFCGVITSRSITSTKHGGSGATTPFIKEYDF